MQFEAQVDKSKAMAFFKSFSPRLIQALVYHVQDYAIFLQSYVRSEKLSGNPLHQRTGNLSKSINIKPRTPAVSDKSVKTSVGTNLEYGRVHELGGTFLIPAYMHPGRVANADIKEAGIKTKGGTFRYESYLVRAHNATYPRRAFLEPSIQETNTRFVSEIQKAIDEAASATA